jgi:restriction endonuclease S subunit
MIGTGGNSCLHMDTNFSCSGDMILLKPLIDNIYIFNILKISWKRLLDNMNGSTIKHVTKSMLVDFQIPIPKTDKLLNKWTNKISEPYDNIQKKKKELEDLEEKVKMEVKRIGDEEKCDMIALGVLLF